jgi:O-antigen ligase
LATKASKIAFVLISVIIVMTTVAYGTVHQPTISLFYIGVAVLVLLWAADAIAAGRVRISGSPLQLPILGAIVYGFIQLVKVGTVAEAGGLGDVPRLITLDPFSTQMTTLHLVMLLVFFSVSLVMIDSAGRIRKLAAIIAIFGFAYAFFAILQSVLSPDKIYGIYESRLGSPFGSFVNRHNFAAYIEMTIAVPLGLLFAGAVSRDKKLLYLTAIALMGVALILSGSRGGLVAFVAEVLFLVILSTGRRSRRRMAMRLALSAALLAAIVGGAFFVGGETSLTRIADSSQQSQDVTSDRAHIWEVTLKVISRHMPLGAGYGALGVAYTAFDNRSGFERVEQAHNDYLQVAADAGVVGILLGGAFLFFVFKPGLAVLRTENTFRRGIGLGAFAGCFAILVHSLFDFVLHTTAITVLFLTLLTLLHASTRKYPDDIADSDHRNTHRHRRSSHSKVRPISQRA